MKIGERIKIIREWQGLSGGELAEATKYLKDKNKIIVKKDDLGYTITNAQNYTLRAKEQAIINYAKQMERI